jgi:hypothetical protein
VEARRRTLAAQGGRRVSEHILVHDLRPQFRLRPGQDDRLIAWLSSFAPRQRSQAIRDALLSYLCGREKRAEGGGWEEDPELAMALDSLF